MATAQQPSVSQSIAQKAMPEQPLKDQIDWSVYRQPELADHVSNLVSLSGNVLTIVKCVLCCVGAFLAGVLLLFTGSLHWTWLIGAVLYSLLSSAVLGIVIGLMFALWGALDSLIEVVRLTIDLARRASLDIQGLREGGKRLPTASELVYASLDNVIMPVVESVVLGKYRWMGRLILGVYRRTLHRMVRRVARAMLRMEPVSPSKSETQAASAGSANEVAGEARSEAPLAVTREQLETAQTQANLLASHLETAQQYVVTMGTGAKAVLLAPLTAAAVVAFSATVIPLFAAWWFGS